jgi:hypothetical protein
MKIIAKTMTKQIFYWLFLCNRYRERCQYEFLRKLFIL